MEELNPVTLPHPIPYQGSKRALAAKILSYFPKDVERLIEPFAGSAAVTLLAAYRGLAKNFSINDVNEPLIRLWAAIVNDPEGIASAYESVWNGQHGREKDYYKEIRALFNDSPEPPYFLFLLARCVKAAVRYNSRGEFNQSPDNRRKGTRPSTMRKNILGASALLRGRASFSSDDYRKTLRLASPNDIVYMDPPYQGVSGNRDGRYIIGLEFQEFALSLETLNDKAISYIVSYDGSCGLKSYGQRLPEHLSLTHIEVDVGRSSQATLLGRESRTIESLYLSPALISRLTYQTPAELQDRLFEPVQ